LPGMNVTDNILSMTGMLRHFLSFLMKRKGKMCRKTLMRMLLLSSSPPLGRYSNISWLLYKHQTY